MHKWASDPHLDTAGDWVDVHTTPVYEYTEAQVPPFGSFIEGFDQTSIVPDPMHGPLSLEGLSAFTIEGWIRPTQVDGGQLVGRDEVVIAGHASQVSPGAPVAGAYLGISGDGHLVGVADLAGGGRVKVEADTRLEENLWYHVALVFDPTAETFTLYSARCEENMQVEAPYAAGVQFAPTECDCDDAPAVTALSSSSSVGAGFTDFRVGARAEAPGNMTGCFSGRIDRLRVWARAVPKEELVDRMSEGGTSCGSPSVFDPLAHPTLLLFLDFEERYLEDPFVPGEFGRYARDSSQYQRHGTVVNHGNPGASGRPLGDFEVGGQLFPAGRSLRLNHEQVHDAKFDEVRVQVDLTDLLDPALNPQLYVDIHPLTGPSGLYVLQAIFEGPSGVYSELSAENLGREHFTSFVVRPAELTEPVLLPTRAAVIVPVNTYMAYNPWPRVAENFWPRDLPLANGVVTVLGLDLRYAPDGQVRAQGANSAYQGFGTREQNWYPSWLRPCAATSPRVPYPDGTAKIAMRNESSCTSAVKLTGWLGDPSGTGAAPAYQSDVFTDADIHRNPCLLDPYGAVLLGAHPEYFSLAMLVGLHKYMDDNGGNILSVGGNSIVWRSEAKDTVETYLDPVSQQPYEVSNYVIEIKKWPEVQSIGEYDGLSHMFPEDPAQPLEPNGRTGAWRFVEQSFPEGNPAYNPGPPGSPALSPATPFHPGGFELGSTRDYILGTVVDSGGVGGNAPGFVCPPGADTIKYGYWKMADTTNDASGPHWLLDGLRDNTYPPTPIDPTFDPLQWVGAGRVIGNESDRFVCHQDILRTFYLNELPLLPDPDANPPEPLDPSAVNQFCMTGIPELYLDGQTYRAFCPPALYMTGLNAFHAAPPTSLPVVFPYSDNGQVDILATGSSFNLNCRYSMVLWCSAMFDTVSADWAMWASGYGGALCYAFKHVSSVMEGHGNIVYYRHRGGGRVLTVAAIDAVNSLVVPPDVTGLMDENSQVRDLVKRALDSMLLLATPGDATTMPVHSTTRPPLDTGTVPPDGFPIFFPGPAPGTHAPVFDTWPNLCGGL